MKLVSYDRSDLTGRAEVLAAILERLSNEINQVVHDPQVPKRFIDWNDRTMASPAALPIFVWVTGKKSKNLVMLCGLHSIPIKMTRLSKPT